MLMIILFCVFCKWTMWGLHENPLHKVFINVFHILFLELVEDPLNFDCLSELHKILLVV